jgi:hypothetical protein
MLIHSRCRLLLALTLCFVLLALFFSIHYSWSNALFTRHDAQAMQRVNNSTLGVRSPFLSSIDTSCTSLHPSTSLLFLSSGLIHRTAPIHPRPHPPYYHLTHLPLPPRRPNHPRTYFHPHPKRHTHRRARLSPGESPPGTFALERSLARAHGRYALRRWRKLRYRTYNLRRGGLE